MRFTRRYVSFLLCTVFCSPAWAGSDIPPPAPLPPQEALAEPGLAYQTPSNEMDFLVPKVPEASFDPAPPPAPPAPEPASADGFPALPASPGAPVEKIDQFFSTTTILPDEPPAPPPVEAAKVPEETKPVKKKSVRRSYVARGYTLQKKREITFHSVVLPETLYRKAYDRENRHLPIQMTYGDLQETLALAVMRGDVTSMRAIVQRGADIHQASPTGESYLIIAARYQQPDAVRWLLQNGAEPQISDAYGGTALHYAARANHHVIANLLLRYGANPNATDRQGATPLSYATYSGALSTAEILRAFGAAG